MTIEKLKEEFIKSKNFIGSNPKNIFDTEFGEFIINPTNDDILLGCFIISNFGYERNYSNISRLLIDLFINKEKGEFIVNNGELISRLDKLWNNERLYCRIAPETYIYKLVTNKNRYIFGSHLYQDWGVHMKKKNYVYKETLYYILKELIDFLSENWISYSLEIKKSVSFQEIINISRNYEYLRKFRGIFMFDFIKTLFYSNYTFSKWYDISINIKDYIVMTDSIRNSELLSRYDTICYHKLKDIDFSPELFGYLYNNEREKVLYIIYLENAMCWYGKEV